MFRNLADGLRADRAPGTVGAARRRRDRRLRAFLKHERLTVAMNLATVQHHSHMKSAVVDVCVQVGSPLAPVTEYVAPAPAVTFAAPAPVIEYVAPAPAVTYAALAPVFEYVATFVVPGQQLRPGVNLEQQRRNFPDNYNYSWFKLKDKCRSEKWKLYLYGGKTIMVDRDRVEVLLRVCLALVLHPTWQRVTHHLWVVPPSERGMGMSMHLAVPVSSGKYSGTSVSTAPAVAPAAMSFTVTLTGSTMQRGCLRRFVV